MSNYILTSNGELYHYGVKGQKWGVRRYQKKDGTLTRAGKRRLAKKQFEADIEAREKKLRKDAVDAYDKSKEGKLYEAWRKKHPKADLDDFGDYLHDIGFDNDGDSMYRQRNEFANRANKLEKSMPRNQALITGVISSVYLAPVTSFITAKATKNKIKNGKVRAAAILGSGVATIGVLSLAAYAGGKSERRKAIKSEGIKSVKERMKEM